MDCVLWLISACRSLQVPYEAFLGGVLQMSGQDYWAINGYSNRFWGWVSALRISSSSICETIPNTSRKCRWS